jgi:hypothetical protein
MTQWPGLLPPPPPLRMRHLRTLRFVAQDSLSNPAAFRDVQMSKSRKSKARDLRYEMQNRRQRGPTDVTRASRPCRGEALPRLGRRPASPLQSQNPTAGTAVLRPAERSDTE